MITSAAWSRDRFWPLLFEALLPLSLGVGLGILVAGEALLGLENPLEDRLTGEVVRQSFPWTLTAVVVAGAGLVLVRCSDFLFERRMMLAGMMPILASGVNGVGFGSIDAFEFALVFSTFVWLAMTFIEGQPIVTPRPLMALLLALVACTVLSAVNGQMGSLIRTRAVLVKVIVVFLATNLITTPRDVYAVTRALIVLALCVALMAIVALIVHWTTGIALTTETGRTMGYKNTPFGKMLRATGLTQNPQSLAHLLIATLGLVVVVEMRRVARWVLVLLCMIGVVFTFSTGAILTAAGVLAISPFVRRPARTLHYLAVGATAVLLVYATGAWTLFYDQILRPAGSAGFQDRTELLRVGLHVIERHPWLGIGLGNTGRVMTHPVHNTYIQMLSETGPLSAVLFVALLMYVVLSCVTLAASHPDARVRALLKGLFLGMVGIMVHFLNNPLFLNVFSWGYIGLAMSAVIVFKRTRSEPGVDHEP